MAPTPGVSKKLYCSFITANCPDPTPSGAVHTIIHEVYDQPGNGEFSTFAFIQLTCGTATAGPLHACNVDGTWVPLVNNNLCD